MPVWLGFTAAAVTVVAIVALLYFLFLGIPLGPPTVHLAPERPIAERTTAPRSLTSLAPRGYIAWIERRIVLAGRQSQWSAAAFIAIKAAVTLPALAVAVLAVVLVHGAWWWIVLCAVFVLLCLVAPEVSLSARADDRQKAIRLELPDTLDQMTIAVEAGLGFDAAMAKAAAGGKGPLAQELIRTMQDISIGQSRREAYRALERRTSSEDLRRFIRAIVQADAYGISVADVLRTQAADMRVRRRQRAEEQAMKVPVKIVFPLVCCILPVLFIVLFTPAVIGLIGAFS